MEIEEKGSKRRRVLVLNALGEPLRYCHPGKARKALDNKFASVYQVYPYFTIILKEGVDESVLLDPCPSQDAR